MIRAESVVEEANRIKFGWLLKAFKARAQAELLKSGNVMITVEFQMPDRDSGALGPLSTSYLLTKAAMASSIGFNTNNTVFKMALDQLKHELMESFLVDGKRVFEPHQNDDFQGVIHGN